MGQGKRKLVLGSPPNFFFHLEDCYIVKNVILPRVDADACIPAGDNKLEFPLISHDTAHGTPGFIWHIWHLLPHASGPRIHVQRHFVRLSSCTIVLCPANCYLNQKIRYFQNLILLYICILILNLPKSCPHQQFPHTENERIPVREANIHFHFHI